MKERSNEDIILQIVVVDVVGSLVAKKINKMKTKIFKKQFIVCV